MAQFFFEFANTSPQVSYAPVHAWSDSQLHTRQVHLTSTLNASATINFHGEEIEIFGTKGPYYGNYTISIDGSVRRVGSAHSAEIKLNRLLGVVKNMTNGPHVAILQNTSERLLDIDRVLVMSRLFAPGSALNGLAVDDTDGRMVFTPPNAWTVEHGSGFFGGSTHNTSSPNAQVSLQFSGDAIAIYGSMHPNHANIDVEIDGKLDQISMGLPGRVGTFHPHVLLFVFQGLHPQLLHNLTMRSRPGGTNGTSWDIDSIVVYSSVAEAANRVGLLSPTPPPVATSSPVASAANVNSSGLIIGFTVTFAALVLATLVTVIYVLYRRKRNRARISVVLRPATPTTPPLPIQDPADSLSDGVSDIASINLPSFAGPPPNHIASTTQMSQLPATFEIQPASVAHSDDQWSSETALATERAESLTHKPRAAPATPSRPKRRPSTLTFHSHDEG